MRYTGPGPVAHVPWDSVTVAVAFVHGDVPGTVYVYTPGTSVPGMKTGACGTVLKAHVPAGEGLPPRCCMSWNGASVGQKVAVPFVPAFAAWFTIMASVDMAFAHGGILCTT